MKKKIIPFITAIIALVISLSGCSCSGSNPLVFNNDFNGGNSPSYPYKETLTYDVNYIESYGSNFNKSPEITDDVLKMNVAGTYVTTLELLDRTDAEKTLSWSNILDKTNDIGQAVYKMTSKLDIKTTYTSKEGFTKDGDDGEPIKVPTLEKDEYIHSEVYFLSTDYSLNPIYSKSDISSSYVAINSELIAMVSYTTYSTETKYNMSDYTITTVYSDNDQTIEQYGYSYKGAIDNNSLLFAMRNISIELDKNHTIPVVHPTYGAAQPLRITNSNERTDKHTVNGIEQDVKVKEYSFMRGVQNGTGAPQFVTIQREKTDNLESKALIMQHVAPLTCYNSFLCLGGLKYTLKSVN